MFFKDSKTYFAVCSILLIIGIILLSIDLALAIRVGYAYGWDYRVEGWARYGKNPVWTELLHIPLYILTQYIALLLISSNKEKRIQLAKKYRVRTEIFTVLTSPLFLAAFNSFILYKMFHEYVLAMR